MKKRIALCMAILVLVCAGIGAYLYVKSPNAVRRFSLDTYEHELIQFASDREMGKIESGEDAAKTAEELWTEIYGETKAQEQKPYRVSYDKQAGAWLVEGRFPLWRLGQKGGTAYLLITDEGDVLAVWHTK